MEAGAAGGGTSAWSAEGVLALTGTFGTMSGRSVALRLGAPSTPLPGPGFGRKADEMQPRTGNQRGESLYEFQRRHHDMGRALSIGCLQGEHHLPGPVECKSVHCRWRAGRCSGRGVCVLGAPSRANPLPWLHEFLPLMGGAAHLGMEAKPLSLTQHPGVCGASCVGTVE